MDRYYNLPREQRRVQRLVALFNSDEELWRSLEPRRQQRRKRLAWLATEQLEQLDLLDFDKARRPQPCVGEF